MVEENLDDWKNPEVPGIKEIKSDKVFLNKIPNELTDDGLRNICQKYGRIKSFFRKVDRQYAFVTFETAAEAVNLLRCLNDDLPNLPVIADIARDRENTVQDVVDEEYEFLDKPTDTYDNSPISNRLEMDKRQIRGPFSKPAEVYKIDSLIQPMNYKNLLLRSADPTKEFLWNSNDETYMEFTAENNKKIIHGRAILKTIDVTNDTKEANASKKSFSFNSDLLPAILNCTTCERPADKICKNCNEPQCSAGCHAAKHTKSLDVAKNAETKQPHVPERIKAVPIDRNVKITAILNHRLVFVRPAEDRDEKMFARLMCDTISCAKRADFLTSMPSIGSLVLAKFDYYQRALVLKRVDSTRVAIAFIDFGNVETRDYRELKFMSDNLKTKKRFATKIALSRIEDDLMNEKALEYLYNLLVFDVELSIKLGPKKTNEVVPAELKSPDKWVNQLIHSMNIEDIKLPDDKNVNQLVSFKDFPQKYEREIDYKKLNGKEAIIIDNSHIPLSLLSFIDAHDWNKFRANDRRIQNVCNYLYTKERDYTPRHDECCVVRYEGRWYRAYCLEVCFDGFITMVFIDYAMMQLIEINDIRSMPDALLFECITISINFIPDHNDMTFEQLEKLKEQYALLSKQKIERIEHRKEIDNFGDEIIELCGWLKNT